MKNTYDLSQEEPKREVRYSPGNYYHRACSYCKNSFTGGKRCTLCTECTLKSDRIEFDMDVRQTVEEYNKETMYSEDEVLDILIDFFDDHVNCQNANVSEWFNNHKKKI